MAKTNWLLIGAGLVGAWVLLGKPQSVEALTAERGGGIIQLLFGQGGTTRDAKPSMEGTGSSEGQTFDSLTDEQRRALEDGGEFLIRDPSSGQVIAAASGVALDVLAKQKLFVDDAGRVRLASSGGFVGVVDKSGRTPNVVPASFEDPSRLGVASAQALARSDTRFLLSGSSLFVPQSEAEFLQAAGVKNIIGQTIAGQPIFG
jgi:hypothetical protein